jgi:hypothetical protein
MRINTLHKLCALNDKHRGKYHLRLYNAKAGKWETVVIDDYVPCKKGKPMFTKPKGNEMWVLLLEKAFAKYVGNYADLEGGMVENLL